MALRLLSGRQLRSFRTLRDGKTFQPQRTEGGKIALRLAMYWNNEV
jgi:hypothetical protein